MEVVGRAGAHRVLGLIPTHRLLRLVQGLVSSTDDWGQVLGSLTVGPIGSWSWHFDPLVGRVGPGVPGLLSTD